MKTVWTKFKCEECGRTFQIEEDPNDRLDEPGCPECFETNCIELSNENE